MELYDSVSVSEKDYPMYDVDANDEVLPTYCDNAEKRLHYALSGSPLSPTMYRRLRDDYISAVGFGYMPLSPLRDAYIRRWVNVYDTSVWTYNELCYFIQYYAKRDVWDILCRRGYSPDTALTDWLDSRKRKVEGDVAQFKSSGNWDYSDLQFVEDYVALLIKDYINNIYVDENVLCGYIVALNLH